MKLHLSHRLSAFLGMAALSALFLIAPASAQIYSTNIGGSIPDGNATGINSTITVTDTFTVGTFNSITITGLNHTYVGDLIITLTHNGTTVDVLDRVRGNGDQFDGDSSNLDGDYTFVPSGGADFNAVATARFNNGIIASNVSYNTLPVGNTNPNGGISSANGLLTDFNGMNVSGVWTLNISDRNPQDTGSFTGFSFNVTPAQAPPTGGVPEPSAVVSIVAFAGIIGGLIVRKRRI